MPLPSLARWTLPVFALLVLPLSLRAQSAAQPPRHAVAVGWSPAAGVIGGEFVRRPSAAGVPLGYALGVGLAGPGARVHVALGRRAAAPAARRVPYAGVSAVTNVWADYVSLRHAGSAEVGVQFWPAARRQAYFDLGGGAAVVSDHGGGTRASPVLRALLGVAF